MDVIQEDTVRQLMLKQGVTEIHVSPDAYVTDQARSYIRDQGLRLVTDGVVADAPTSGIAGAGAAAGKSAGAGAAVVDAKTALPVNEGIRPAREMARGRFKTLDGQALDAKPEHMTHLHGNVLVPKTHERIALRGTLDDLQADILNVQVDALDAGEQGLVDGLQETLDFCRQIMSAEVMEQPFEAPLVLGLDAEQQRAVSHAPKKYLGVGHLMPDVHMGRLPLALNKLRTKTRATELTCARAFEAADGSCERMDLVQALNRLSSTFYILMLSYIAAHAPKDC